MSVKKFENSKKNMGISGLPCNNTFVYLNEHQ